MARDGVKVLVTGGDGFIGGALARRLQTEGVEVVAPQRFGLNYDLTERRACHFMLEEYQPTHVVHCAAYRIAGIADHKADPAAPVTENLVMTARLLEACAKARPQPERFIFLSSSTVYPLEPQVPFDEEWSEGWKWPSGVYEGVGGMKLYLEKLCRFYWNHFGMAYTILRPTAVYGPEDKSSHVIPSLALKMLSVTDPCEDFRSVWGSRDTVRDFVYVEDVVSAILAAIHQGPKAAGVVDPVNIGSGERWTIGEIARCIWLTSHRDVPPEELGPIHFDKDKPTAIPYRQVSIERAKRLWGWEPIMPIPEGIERTVTWWRKFLGKA